MAGVPHPLRPPSAPPQGVDKEEMSMMCVLPTGYTGVEIIHVTPWHNECNGATLWSVEIRTGHAGGHGLLSEEV